MPSLEDKIAAFQGIIDKDSRHRLLLDEWEGGKITHKQFKQREKELIDELAKKYMQTTLFPI